MLTISNVNHVMAGLREMVDIAIRANGLTILKSMPRLVNMCCFITLKVGRDIGSLEISVMKFEKGDLK
jgi:hypothetical protein